MIKPKEGVAAGGLAQHVAAVCAGLVTGLVVLVICISFAALVYQGELAPHLSQGISIMLTASIVFLGLMAMTSGLPHIVVIPQDIPAAILGVGAGMIAAGAHGSLSSGELSATVSMFIALAGLAAGLLFCLIGTFRLGNLVRYIPFPVVGGFLAGTGWLLFSGGIGIMCEVTPGLSTLGQLFREGMPVLWGPGLAFALTPFLATHFLRHSLTAPLVILAGCLLFYAGLLATGTGVVEARDMGLLLSGIPESGIWAPPGIEMLSRVHWPLLGEGAMSILAISLMSVVAMLLNTSGLEILNRTDMDVNRELKLTGYASVLAALGGGAPGYASISLSALNRSLGARGRVSGVIAAGLCLVVLLAGGSLLNSFPLAILGGLVSFLGLGLLKEWVVDSYGRFPLLDYCLMLGILLVIAWAGFLQGVLAGCVAAVFLFVINYSRVPVIRSRHDASGLPCDVERNPIDRQLLAGHPDSILMVRLQGYLFFGTVSGLLDQMREWCAAGEARHGQERFMILDFTLVTGFDSSLLNGFGKIRLLAEANNMVLVLTGLRPGDDRRFRKGGHVEDRRLHHIPDRSQAMEWCEERVLASMRTDMARQDQRAPLEAVSGAELECLMEESLELMAEFEDILHSLGQYLHRTPLEQGEVLIEQGGSADSLYFLESGSLEAVSRKEGGPGCRIKKILAGSVVGEMGLYGCSQTTVEVRALDRGLAWRLDGQAMQDMEARHPDIALKIHRYVARLLSRRLNDANLVRDALY